MAHCANPCAFAPGAASQGYINIRGGWADHSGAGSMQFQQMLPGQAAGMWFPGQGYTDAMADHSGAGSMQFQQMLPGQAAGMWFPGQGYTDAMWYASQATCADASMFSAPAANMGVPDPSGKGTHPKQASMPKAPPPPGISGTTPVKAGASVPNNGDKTKTAAVKADLFVSGGTDARNDEAGVKAGKFLLNLVNNKEEKPGAILLHHLWSGPPATQEAPPSDLAAFRTDNGVGMALLQQVKKGANSAHKNDGGKKGAGRPQGSWWGGEIHDHRNGGGKTKEWWTRAEEWHSYHSPSGTGYGYGYGHTPQQWGRTKAAKGGKGWPRVEYQEEESIEDSEETSSFQNLPTAGANSRWRQGKSTKGAKGKGKGKEAANGGRGKGKWKPAK